MNNSDNKIILLVSLIGIFQKKFTPPERKGILKNITGEEGGWLAASRNPEERF